MVNAGSTEPRYRESVRLWLHNFGKHKGAHRVVERMIELGGGTFEPIVLGWVQRHGDVEASGFVMRAIALKSEAPRSVRFNLLLEWLGNNPTLRSRMYVYGLLFSLTENADELNLVGKIVEAEDERKKGSILSIFIRYSAYWDDEFVGELMTSTDLMLVQSVEKRLQTEIAGPMAARTIERLGRLQAIRRGNDVSTDAVTDRVRS
jgi:hypothetical protein